MKLFRYNSKPIFCRSCSKYFHKTKQFQCFNHHSCKALGEQNRASPSFQDSIAPHTVPAPPTADAAQVADPLPSSSGSAVPPAATQTENSSTGTSSDPHLLSGGTNYQAVLPHLDPNASTFNPRQSQPKTSKGKKLNTPGHSSETLEIEYLKVELNNARTQIVILDSEIEEYKKKMSILNSRVKFLTDRENERLHKEYFPSQTTNIGSHTCPPKSPPVSHNQCCHQSFQPIRHPEVQPEVTRSTIVDQTLQVLTKQVEQLCNDVRSIKVNLPTILSATTTNTGTDQTDDSRTMPKTSEPPPTSSAHDTGTTPIPATSNNLTPADMEEFIFDTYEGTSVNYDSADLN